METATQKSADIVMRYPVGTKFKPIGKDYVCTVADLYITRNLAGNIVGRRYVAKHEFCGQTVTNFDVVETTIARGLLN